jgi:hypothetical protein
MSLTRSQAIAQIAVLVPTWSEANVRGFVAATSDEQALMIQSLIDCGAMPGPSAWDAIIAVLKLCAELASLVTPLTGVISGVYGVAKL